MLRLFIAIPVPLDVRKRIEEFQQQLQCRSPVDKIRWTPPEQFHITLNFLGEVLEERVETIKAAAAKVCSGFAAIQISANGVGYFRDFKNPRVVWVGANDKSSQMSVLHMLLTKALRSSIQSKKEDPFSGHITLGRFFGASNPENRDFLKLTTPLQMKHFGGWNANAVEIIRSDLSPAGAKHTLLLSCPLASKHHGVGA